MQYRDRVACEARGLHKLSAMGHNLHVHKEYSTSMGRGKAVLHDSKTEINYGASDARADGSAEPEPPPEPALMRLYGRRCST